MAYQDALVILAGLLQLPDAATTKANIIAIAQAASPPIDVSSMVLGEPTERWIEIASQAMDAWGSVPTQMGRGMFLQLSTDPGDVADDGVADQSADQTPRPGFLSALGAAWYFTIRGEQTAAQTTVNWTNTSGSTQTIPAGSVTIERSYAATDGSTPTYYNQSAFTVNAGVTASVTFICAQLGSYGTATANSLTILQTQTYGTATVTNPAAANGSDREPRSTYINRCLTAPDSNAPGGPLKAYVRAATTGANGSILLNYATGLPVAITGALVLPSATQMVTGYLYGASGAVSTTDVSSANWNITGAPATLSGNPATGGITLSGPLGVLPDTVSIGPTVSDPATLGPGFASAINQPVLTHWTGKIKGTTLGTPTGTYATPYVTGATYGVGQKVVNGTTHLYVVASITTGISGTGPTGTGTGIVDGGVTWNYVSEVSANTAQTLALFTAVASAIDAYLPALGPGAQDSTGGAGTVYVSDLQDVTHDGYAGLYSVALVIPAANVSVGVGLIQVGATMTAVLTVV